MRKLALTLAIICGVMSDAALGVFLEPSGSGAQPPLAIPHVWENAAELFRVRVDQTDVITDRGLRWRPIWKHVGHVDPDKRDAALTFKSLPCCEYQLLIGELAIWQNGPVRARPVFTLVWGVEKLVIAAVFPAFDNLSFVTNVLSRRPAYVFDRQHKAKDWVGGRADKIGIGADGEPGAISNVRGVRRTFSLVGSGFRMLRSLSSIESSGDSRAKSEKHNERLNEDRPKHRSGPISHILLRYDIPSLALIPLLPVGVVLLYTGFFKLISYSAYRDQFRWAALGLICSLLGAGLIATAVTGWLSV